MHAKMTELVSTVVIIVVPSDFYSLSYSTNIPLQTHNNKSNITHYTAC